LSAADDAKPWLISGSGRSGTSALALVCEALGLRLLCSGRLVAEYRPMRLAYAARDLDGIRAIRKEWTAGTLIKTPGLGVAAAHNPEMAAALDCNYIFSFRDAVAQNYYDPLQHPEANQGEMMRNRARMEEQAAVSGVLLSKSTGVIMVSYEKLIQPRSNAGLLSHLCTLIGCDLANVEAAVRVIEPEAPEYRKLHAEDAKVRDLTRDQSHVQTEGEVGSLASGDQDPALG
jgi:hypothetical protein